MSEPPAPAPAPAPIQRRIISGNKSEIPALLGDPRPHLSRQDTIDAFRIPPIRIDPLSNNALSPISLPRLPVRVDLKQLDIARQQLKAISTLGGVPEDSNDQEAATTFTIEAPEKKGILWLQFGQSWEQRWCVLKEGNLYIFETQKAIIPLETLWLGGGVIKDRPDLEQNCFSVTTSDKQIRILHADEEYEYFTWIVTLRGATFYLRIAGAKAPALAVKAQPAIQMPRISVHPAAVKSAPTTPAPHAQVEATKTQQQTSRPTSSEGPYLYFGRVKVSPTVDKRATKFFGTHRRHSSPEIQPIFAGKIKAGYLTVPEGKLFTSWKPRWVLLEGDSLYVFNSEADEPNKDEAIVTIKVLFCNAKVVKSTQSKYIFEVIMMAKNTTFGAATGAEMLEWIGAIQEAQATLMGQYLQYDVLSTSAPTPSGYGGEEQVDDLTKSKQMLNTVLHIAGNDKCADCTAPDILWASINLGVFLCINCSGVHRSMGVHISKVRSVTMDKWESSTIQFMEETGNTRVNLDLEYLFPPGYTKLLPNAATGEREKYIRNKYEAKLFARPA